MGVFDDMEAADAALFCDDAAFPGVETFVYKPTQGEWVTITGPVWRMPPEPLPGPRGVAGPLMKVFVRRHATAGVLAVKPTTDKIEIARDKGGTAEDMPVLKVLSDSAAGWMLQLR